MKLTLNQPDGSPKFRWQDLVAKYQFPDTWRSLWQVANTLIPFFVLWYAMARLIDISYWLTLLLVVPTAAFMVRGFIIFHDCCHGSFFKTQKANDRLGLLLGVLMFTPYFMWKHEHAIHHATAGDLDRRGIGDVWTMTVDEYMTAPWWKKIAYRIMRNPFILFTVGSFGVFAFAQRFASPGAGKRERNSVIWTNLAILGIIGWLMIEIGWKAFLMIQVPLLLVAASAGVWLFYVQHNFDPTYWERHDKWEFFKAGMAGSSFYRLPRILQWFSGNIGFHHIHHLSPKIPNYKLEQCYRENPLFQIEPLTFMEGFKGLFYRLWDEKRQMLVGFDALKLYRKQTIKA